jgi:hypothetical protein
MSIICQYWASTGEYPLTDFQHKGPEYEHQSYHLSVRQVDGETCRDLLSHEDLRLVGLGQHFTFDDSDTRFSTFETT